MRFCSHADFGFLVLLAELVYIIQDLKVREGLHHFEARYNTVNELKNRGSNGKKNMIGVCYYKIGGTLATRTEQQYLS